MVILFVSHKIVYGPQKDIITKLNQVPEQMREKKNLQPATVHTNEIVKHEQFFEWICCAGRLRFATFPNDRWTMIRFDFNETTKHAH